MKSNMSNVLAVLLTLIIFTSIMLVSLTATTEADDSFKPTEKEEAGMEQYYDSCPFKKAELGDLTAEASIRDAVTFLSVDCDPEKKKEKVVVEINGERPDSRQKFENWLELHQLSPGKNLELQFK